MNNQPSTIFQKALTCLLMAAFILTSNQECLAQEGSEYADILVDAYCSICPDDSVFYGGTKSRFPIQVLPEKVLGGEEDYFVSLPSGSYLIVQFTDNIIIDYPEQDDIFITEIGCSDERAEVYVSSNGKRFEFLGIVDDCHTSSLDLADINYTREVKFLLIKGLDSKGHSPGYDVISIKGLPNSNVDLYVEPDSLDLFLQRKDSVAKKIILENIHFDFNRAEIKEESFPVLDDIVEKLTKYSNRKIKIVGHTDDVGDDSYNLNLSQERARAIFTYLIEKGIEKDRLRYEGKGETEPLKGNETEEGRSINRRVELEIIE